MSRRAAGSKGRGEYRQAWRQNWIGAMLLALFGSFPLLVMSGCAGLIGGSPQTSGIPSLAVSPASVSFGKVSTGQKMTQSLTLTNTGTVALTIQQATASNAQFGFSGITLPMSLGAGQSANLSVWLNGTATGTVTGTLTFQAAGVSIPEVINLTGTVTSGTQPHLTLTPGALDFSAVSVGTKGTSNLTIGNTGATDLLVSVVTLNGAAFGLSGIATPRTISAGQTVPVSVTFSPSAAGAASGSISITSNDPANPTATVALSGTGSTVPKGQLSANPTSLSFGSVATGSNASQSIVVTNTGNAAVTISKITTAGNGYSVTGVTTPVTLSASQTTTLTAKFAPTTAGNATGTITVASDAPGSPLTISLTGAGTQAGLSVSPASFNFGSIVDGQTKSQNFTVTNTGTATLTIAQLSVAGAGYSASGLNTPTTIAAGKTATFSVLFAPTTAGVLSGSVSIASNTATSPNVVAVSGTGVAASVTISANPTSLSFGSVNAGVSSAKSVTLTNSGNSNLTISQVSVTGKDLTASGITTPLTLTPGQKMPLTLTFKPTAAETVTGNVTLSSTQGSSAVIPLSGTGVQAGLAVTPGSVSFGNVTVGAPNSQTIQLSNSGTGVLTITQLSVTGSGFSAGTMNLPLSINPGASTTFNVQFAPQSAGATSGSVSLVSNAASSPSAVALSGTGVATSLTLSTNPSSLNFGTVNTGSTAQQSITLTDTGNSSITISQMTVTGTGYTLSGASTPLTLAPSQSSTITVHFSPAATGSVSGSVRITSNSTGSPATVALSGTGAASVQHTVALNWSASTSSVSGYNVYRSTVSGTGYTQVNSSLVASLNFSDSTVQNATTYYYVTTAVDGSGNESPKSNEAQAIVP